MKIRLPEGIDWTARLRAIGATRGSETVQDDTFWSHPQRDFAQTDEALRVRREAARTILTYKGPRLEADAKVRPEYNVGLEESPDDLLGALGFAPTARLNKHRTTWLFAGVEVAMDSVAGLGSFIEIEALTGVDDPVRVIEGVRDTLGLSDEPAIQESYLALALAAGASSAARTEGIA